MQVDEGNRTAPATSENSSMTLDEGMAALDALTTEPEKTIVGEAKPAGNDEIELTADDLELDNDETGNPDDQEFDQDPEPVIVKDDTKIMLDDGSVVTVAELKKNNMFQRDYTKKNQALADSKKEFEAIQNQVREHADRIASERNVIMALAQQILVPPPNDALMDENGENWDPIEYMGQKARYEKQQAHFAQLEQEDENHRQFLDRQNNEQHQEFLNQEFEALLEAMPKLKDEKERVKFKESLVAGAEEFFKIPVNEVHSIADHKYLMVLDAAVKYLRAVNKVAASKQPTGKALPVIGQKQSVSKRAVSDREYQKQRERFAKSGTIEDALKLM